MKKLVIVEPKKCEIIEVPTPEINDDQILVKIKYYGVCMSEHHAWEIAEKSNGIDEGLGHEPMGYVEKVGKNVTKVKPGDRVTGLFGTGIAEYNVATEDKIFKIPDNVKDEYAIGEPLSCALSAVSKCRNIFPGETSIGVVGCGYMGCAIISLLKLRGAGKIIAVDVNEESRKNALKYGADEVYTPDTVPAEYLAGRDNPAEGGLDLVYEWAETNESIDLAIRMTKMCGQLCIGAYHTGEKRLVDLQLCGVKAIDMLNTHPREFHLSQKGCQNALDMLSRGKWCYQGFPVKIYPMNKFDEAHTDITKKYGIYMKSLIDCTIFDGEPYIFG